VRNLGVGHSMHDVVKEIRKKFLNSRFFYCHSRKRNIIKGIAKDIDNKIGHVEQGSVILFLLLNKTFLKLLNLFPKFHNLLFRKFLSLDFFFHTYLSHQITARTTTCGANPTSMLGVEWWK
jgi:hypothetical protein